MPEVHELESAYTQARRQLFTRPEWVYGPLNMMRVLDPIIKAPDLSLAEKSFCEVGCGIIHPAGASALLFLNGASRTVGFDLFGPSTNLRAAEALYDLVIRCMSEPDAFHFSGTPRKDFIERTRAFDLQKLVKGDFAGGLRDTGVEHYVTSIYALDPAVFKDFDVTYSRAVLEHIPDFAAGCKALWEITAPGGVGFHVVDFVDHRSYKDPKHFNAWSFLCEGEVYQVDAPSYDVSNRLRPSEIQREFDEAGFEAREYFRTTSEMPEEVRSQLHPRFQQFAIAELEARQVGYRIMKPPQAGRRC